ncbi:hypothetical protein DOTSEDRAFT_23592 [Dothistroma septosporum NZE10]|uniref:Rhodopsin domain-containing protein n=1 Tax=Dothistroma septosporum (strain NZE10 / CBS 128990) TaxID=675120 RepID=N1PT39_DOTSN|nr:hypothetical protein DOTSEDRAFT_23592 [Dothistroma septosporum NZE10]
MYSLGRFLSRTPAFGGRSYGRDDWTVLFCYMYVSLVPTDVTAEIEVQNGPGKDVYMVSVDQIVKVFLMLYLGELFYGIIVMATKFSLLFRIWTADSVTPAFRIAC